jgi:hypothetical protein
MLRGVREAFRDDVVDGRFDGLGQAVGRRRGELNGKGGAAGERLQGRHQPAVGENRGVKAAGELLELLERPFQILADALEQCLCCGGILVQALLRHPQLEGEGDEPLLSAVVQVPFQPLAFGDARLDDPRARGRELIVRLGGLQGEGDELGEVGEALLRLRREVAGLRREDEEGPPASLTGGDRCDDRGQVARETREPGGLARDRGIVVDAAALVGRAIHGAAGLAVGNLEPHVDAAAPALAPGSDDETAVRLPANRGGRARLEQPPGLLGNRLKHGLRCGS